MFHERRRRRKKAFNIQLKRILTTQPHTAANIWVLAHAATEAPCFDPPYCEMNEPLSIIGSRWYKTNYRSGSPSACVKLKLFPPARCVLYSATGSRMRRGLLNLITNSRSRINVYTSLTKYACAHLYNLLYTIHACALLEIVLHIKSVSLFTSWPMTTCSKKTVTTEYNLEQTCAVQHRWTHRRRFLRNIFDPDFLLFLFFYFTCAFSIY